MSKVKEIAQPLDKLELSNKPTLVITKKIKHQIDFLHSKVGNAEWSGELITREEGNINDLDKWRIIAEDIYLADIGTGAFTGYEVDKGGFKSTDIVEMYETHLGLLDGTLKAQHIHSHHNMGCFFSGTDWENLHDRALVSNYFLMLIVNHKGDYVAKVAFKADTDNGKNTKLKLTNNTDGFKDIVLNGKANKQVLVVMDCDIEWEEPAINVTDAFKEKYELVKAAIEADKKTYVPLGIGYAPGYTRGASFGGFKKDTRTKDLWDEERPEFDKYKKPGKKDKKISEMTEKEWIELQEGKFMDSWSGSVGGGYNGWDWEKGDEDLHRGPIIEPLVKGVFKTYNQPDVRRFLNCLIGGKQFSMDYSIPNGKILAKDATLKSRQDLEEYMMEINTDLEEVFKMQHPGSSDFNYISLLNSVIENIAPLARGSRLMTELVKTIQEEIDEKILFSAEQD